MKKNLEVGEMTTEELAEWFGIAYSTFRKKAKQLYKELEFFCNYTRHKGGITVQEVYIDKYIKKLTDKDSDTYLKLVIESNNGLCSVAGMARKLQSLYPEVWGKLSESSIVKRLSETGFLLFGKTNLSYNIRKGEINRGPYGYKEYRWAIKVDNFNNYRKLTEEESKIFDTLIESYNVSQKDIVEWNNHLQKKKKEFAEDRITKQEFILAIEKMDLFPKLLERFREETGLTLVRATAHELDMIALLEKKK